MGKKTKLKHKNTKIQKRIEKTKSLKPKKYDATPTTPFTSTATATPTHTTTTTMPDANFPLHPMLLHPLHPNLQLLFTVKN